MQIELTGVLGDDLRELLGHRIPSDHSRQTVADAYAERFLARPGRPPAPRVMDLGCGRGESVELFRGLEPAVRWVGVDLERSPEVDERTRSDAEFVTFDGVNLPFADASFDLVYCKQVLEHVRHPDRLSREVARVLAPGGWFAGSTSQLEAFHSRSIFNVTPHGLTLIVEDAGMDVIELRPVIDGLTLVAWRALGLPSFFYRWWGPRESPLNRVIELAGRARGLDARTRNQIKLTLCGQVAFLAERPAAAPAARTA